MPHATHICCFTALDDVPRKQRGDLIVVLRALERVGRFSCFEMDRALASTVMEIRRRGWTKHEVLGYPWTKVEITEAGRAALAEHI